MIKQVNVEKLQVMHRDPLQILGLILTELK